MKSYLSGNPGLRLALNEDLVVGKGGSSGRGPSYGGVVLDDCNFHECVNLDDFEATRTLALVPPDGVLSDVLLCRFLFGLFAYVLALFGRACGQVSLR